MSVYSNHAYDLVADDYKDRYVNSYNIENSTGDLSFNSKYVIVDNKSARVITSYSIHYTKLYEGQSRT